MNVLRLSLAGMLAVVVTAQIGAVAKDEKADNAKLIVGKWEVTKVEADQRFPFVGLVYEFSKDGTLTIRVKVESGEKTLASVDYNIKGDQLWLSKSGEKTGPFIIKKVIEKELILEGPDKKLIQFKRLP